MQRLARKGRLFDLVILDPPTFSRSKQHGTFQAEKDYSRLLSLALPLLRPDAVLLASTNAAGLPPETFLHWIESAVRTGNRRIAQRHYVPQPLDFPITRDEPGYLKTVWVRIV
jgi:23S rRNA (cytosine1962-C5)-methyltransferase